MTSRQRRSSAESRAPFPPVAGSDEEIDATQVRHIPEELLDQHLGQKAGGAGDQKRPTGQGLPYPFHPPAFLQSDALSASPREFSVGIRPSFGRRTLDVSTRRQSKKSEARDQARLVFRTSSRQPFREGERVYPLGPRPAIGSFARLRGRILCPPSRTTVGLSL